jgi:hypothetical protein
MEKDNCENHFKHRKYNRGAGGGGAVYGLGVIGALVYYWGSASTFLLFLFGLFKAVFWPAFLVYEALKFLHM